MNKRHVRKTLRETGSGEPVTAGSAMAAVKRPARFAHVAGRFGYVYADVRQGGRHGAAPPPLGPEAVEPLEARIRSGPYARQGPYVPTGPYARQGPHTARPSSHQAPHPRRNPCRLPPPH
ncbi:hypothetical protein [Streptomyces sp. enrichment culture]|uniref:hypothetical protein n=1 Tax=Streptomyces sp. enrichment culture TaxID=1795815 RepID=UPI003F55428A